MSNRIATLLTTATVILFVPALAATARADDFNPAPGTYAVDTTAMTITGPSPATTVVGTGTDVGGVAVFSFGNINIAANVTLNARGSRPFEFVASGSLTLAGVIDGSGAAASNFIAGPNPGGPGGGAGSDGTHAGAGSGGGGVPSSGNHGGGGGGFGGAGAAGGCSNYPTRPETGICPSGQSPGPGGTSYGDLNALLQGGSGGGGGSGTGGGGGGGAIALFGSSLTITPTGSVLADGGNGAAGGFGASGGGSGGGILVHGDTLKVDGLLSATGGQGGAGGCCGDGGGGGGGRIAYQYVTLVSDGTAKVDGGTSGTAGGLPHGGQSADNAGFAGVVTKLQGVQASTGSASNVSSTGATLNGTVDPMGTTTTFHFEYGTTTAYGARIPSLDQVVGSDGTAHGLSQAVSGLRPSTTYHFRIIATDGHGLVARGADMTFTTPPPTPSAPNTKVTKVKISAKKHEATFKFKAIGDAMGFQCELKRKHKKARFHKCTSPKRYEDLKDGKYIFEVRAVGPGGADRTPAKRRFKIGD